MINLTLPALRGKERRHTLACRAFYEKQCAVRNKVYISGGNGACNRIQLAGNVRELLHVIHRAILLSPGSIIEPSDLPLEDSAAS